MSIGVENTVRCYEVDAKECRYEDRPVILVRNHWNRPDLVVLIIDGRALTVVARDLATAIENATRTGR